MASPSRARRPGRSDRAPGLARIDWGRALPRAALLLVSIVAACGAFLSAVQEVALDRNPVLVESFTGNPVAALAAFAGDLAGNPRRIADAEAVRLARGALNSDPLNPLPLRILAMRAAATGDAAGSTAFAHLAERVTRRDLPTQLMLIEYAVQRNDIGQALVHYDIALRASDQARSVLFPILSSAISHADIRDALIPYVRMRANWIAEFLQFAMRDGASGPAKTASLLISAGVGGQADLMSPVAPILLGLLVDHREFDMSRQLLQQISSGAAGLLQDTGFTANTTNGQFGPFAWVAAGGDSAMGASFEGQAGSDRRVAHVFANSGERGIALRRVTALAPGQYLHDETRSLNAGDDTSRAHWEMKCLGNAASEPIWREAPDRADNSSVHAAGPLVPGGCPYQLLELQVVAGENPQGLELAIENFRLARRQ